MYFPWNEATETIVNIYGAIYCCILLLFIFAYLKNCLWNIGEEQSSDKFEKYFCEHPCPAQCMIPGRP